MGIQLRLLFVSFMGIAVIIAVMGFVGVANTQKIQQKYEALSILQTEVGETASGKKEYATDTSHISKETKNLGSELVLESDELAQKTQAILVTGAFFALLWLIVLTVFVSRTVTKPLKQLRDVTNAVLKGDLAKRAMVQGVDGISMLAKNCNDMIDHVVSEESTRQQIIDILPCSLFMIDTSGTIEYANASAEILLGYNKKELVGKSLRSVFPNTTTTGSQATPFDSLLEKGSIQAEAFALRAKDGSESPVLLYGQILDTKTQGKASVVLVATDRRTEKKYAEIRLASIMETLQNVAGGDYSGQIAVLDKDDEFSNFSITLNLILDDIKEAIAKKEELNKGEKKRNQELELKTLVLNDTKNALKETFDILDNDKLEIEKAGIELKERVSELERINKLMVGRELKMRELKVEIKKLKGGV